ncbi:hypothetical protein [Mastigocoleus testarum]|uniref:Uncharacterized protein n=1 Tax=Mastigocoleus testarum BC008 TaxID=371196 RepID=A0A0V7ZVS8_9CYAN|nr:hypothetical protein [Mastigocoleus testarum]KST68728.1 hypothetical protein BC008_01870 [Mastigocoleus testarum BC008]KST68740.1 hypothetical protein BC008_01930 [Mastigocoleus testarum BC008]
MTFSPFSEFFSNSNGMKMYLDVGDVSVKPSSVFKLQKKKRQGISPQESCLFELHPAFSHMTVLLMESVLLTGHGEFMTRSKKENYQIAIQFSGHISHRYRLNRQEIEEVQIMYDNILENWIAWKQSDKGKVQG